MSAAVWLLVAFGIALVFAVPVVAVVRASRRDSDEAEDDESGDDGGSQHRRPPDRPPEPSGETPEWWPRFEREFAEYARRSSPTAR